MSAEPVLAEAMIAALRGALGDRVNGVFAGPPVKATAPWVELGALVAADWGTKDAAGRELRIVATIRDRAEQAARIHALVADAGTAIAALPRDLAGWRIASIAFVRTRIASDRPGEWSAQIEHRVRLLATA